MDEAQFKEKLVLFFERKPICVEAAKPLKDSISVELRNAASGVGYTLTKAGERLRVSDGAPAEREMVFTITEAALVHVADFDTDDIGTYGIRVFETMIWPEASRRMRIALKAGPIKLGFKGYFGVLMLGGKTIWKWLSLHGLGSLGKVKDAIKKLMG
ncbi:MAG: hypothetical protein A2284_11960 [Deltaproteobacteria bacterium RIFOXYA12_FULL_61_11]|nr:MAG: hypothetical protein A2284_11960 [Deltaproteobacteria bacterium RIFOXYA12_FULL_61_11]